MGNDNKKKKNSDDIDYNAIIENSDYPVQKRTRKIYGVPDEDGNNPDKVSTGELLYANFHLGKMPRVDLKNTEEVQKRIDYFFRYFTERNMKPGVEGLAYALGISSQELWSINTGKSYTIWGLKNIPQSTIEVIKNARQFLGMMLESYLINDKIHPAAGIFLAKNQLGYQDKVEHVVTAGMQNEEVSAEDIKKRYMNIEKNAEETEEVAIIDVKENE